MVCLSLPRHGLSPTTWALAHLRANIWYHETWQALLAVPTACQRFKELQNPATFNLFTFPTKDRWNFTPNPGKTCSNGRLLPITSLSTFSMIDDSSQP